MAKSLLFMQTDNIYNIEQPSEINTRKDPRHSPKNNPKNFPKVKPKDTSDDNPEAKETKRSKRNFRIPYLKIALAIVILLPYAGIWLVKNHYANRMELMRKSAIIIVDKRDLTLKVMDFNGQILMETGIACGSNFGDKQYKGDHRTPEGLFKVSQIQDAHNWEHDFGDGKGVIQGAYGPYFFRLDTPGHQGIGIHGTHDPSSIGSRATEGCIRVENGNLETLYDKVYYGMPVIILPSEADILENAKNICRSEKRLKDS